MKTYQEPDSKNSTLISSKRLQAQSRPPLMTLTYKRIRLMKSFLSEVLLEFPKSDNSSKTSSMEKNPTLVSTPMRLLPTELPFKEVSYVEKKVKKLKVWSSLMPPHFHQVLKLSEESCQSSFPNHLSSQPRNLRSSQPIKITNKQSLSKSSKEKDP